MSETPIARIYLSVDRFAIRAIGVNKYSQKDVPEIKLCGDWLQSLGFEIGDRVTVTSMSNLLIIRTTE